MIKMNNKKQLELPRLEMWRTQYSNKKVNILAKGWAGVFRKFILVELPVKKLMPFYCSGFGRPTKELYSIMGATILQQFFNLTDEETIEELAFNQQWHFALECFNEEDQVISLKTLWTMRNQMVSLQIGNEIFEKATDYLVKYFNVNTDKQRLDSVHVYSNMAKLGRIRILAKATELFLKSLKKEFNDQFESNISQEIKDVYFKDKGIGVFGQVKPSEAENTLQNLAEVMNSLLLMFANNDKITSLKSFKLLERVFSEHCDIKDSIVVLKKPKETKCTSIQNPSDQDAGYDGHKGQGYQTQISETYSTKSDKEDSDNPPIDLITYVKTESAAIHDSHAVLPTLEDLQKRDICPEILLCDTAYGSEKNVNAGKENNVEIVSPVPGTSSKRGLEDFKFDKETLKITACPAGKKPDQIKIGKNDRYCVKWNNKNCNQCPYEANCPAKKCLNNRTLYYRKTEAVSFLRKAYEKTEEFKEKYRYRSGIEATNSRFISQTEARRSRYRGLDKMSFAQALKAMAINVFRIKKSKQWKSCFMFFLVFLLNKLFWETKNNKICTNLRN